MVSGTIRAYDQVAVSPDVAASGNFIAAESDSGSAYLVPTRLTGSAARPRPGSGGAVPALVARSDEITGRLSVGRPNGARFT